jgi:hypothetical protein
MAGAKAPTKTYQASIVAGQATGNSAITATIVATDAWEMNVPFAFRYGANVSLDATISVYPSYDGGANFDTVPWVSFNLARVANTLVRGSVRLPGGIYAVQMRNSGPSGTFCLFTAEEATAVEFF